MSLERYDFHGIEKALTDIPRHKKNDIKADRKKRYLEHP